MSTHILKAIHNGHISHLPALAGKNSMFVSIFHLDFSIYKLISNQPNSSIIFKVSNIIDFGKL